MAAHWENKYFEDMARLHVLPPDIVTRVSEYVDEIVSFVERIQDNGFAYEGGGSVWFDVTKFEGAEGDGFRHEYAKLQPGSKGNKKLIDEGEGRSHETRTSTLRDVANFHRCLDWIPGQKTSSRLCALESEIKTWRAGMAVQTMGRRSSRMAHRMFRHG